ncbi:MAG: hypothetical protein WBE60_01030 [Nitrosotalea sp.]
MVSKFLKYALVIVLSGVIAVVVSYNFGFVDKCPIKQIDITSDLKTYDQTKDPELCAQLNDEISQFDNDCKGNVDILDCG